MSPYAKDIHRAVKREQWPEAWSALTVALNEAPENPELLYLAGTVLRAQHAHGMALPLFAKALSKDKKQPNLWMHYGATLHDLNRWFEAIEAFKVVNRMFPKDPNPMGNIGASYVQMGKWKEAIEWCDRSLALDPEYYIAHISKSFACLALGRWAEGWDHARHLYGKHLHVRIYREPENEEPEWDGSPGKTVVVQADQGVGDIIMFAQCLPDMVKDCKQVIVECAARLVPLIERNFPGVKAYGTLKDARQAWAKEYDIDAHCHISALPKWYRRSEEAFPRKAYITPNADLVSKWRAWLDRFPKPWIGVSWKGGIQQTQTHLRSLMLDQLEPVLGMRGTFIDLSYKDNSREIAEWNIRGGSQVIRPHINEADYEDTMALLWALDEVVTVTTTVVHACGAMGRSARVLVNEQPQWRYTYDMKDSGMIWYPSGSVSLYRKRRGEEWSGPIQRLYDDIRPRVVLA